MWNIVKACAVSGHRNCKGFSTENIEEIFLSLIKEGYDTFLIGMAIGFDFFCFKELEKIKKIHDIKLVACIPCPNQSMKYSDCQKREYFRMLSVADEIIQVSDKYNSYCMHKRNRFMVDNSSCLVCFLRRQSGGTFYTYNYAKNLGKRIISV